MVKKDQVDQEVVKTMDLDQVLTMTLQKVRVKRVMVEENQLQLYQKVKLLLTLVKL